MMEKVYYPLFNADQNLGVLHCTITALTMHLQWVEKVCKFPLFESETAYIWLSPNTVFAA